MLTTKINNTTGFIVNSILFFLIWFVVYFYFIVPQTDIDLILSNMLVKCSDILLSFLGFETYSSYTEGMVIIALKGTDGNGVWIGNNCNGLNLFALFTFYCLSFSKEKEIRLKRLITNWIPVVFSIAIIIFFYNINYTLNIFLNFMLISSFLFICLNKLNLKKLLFLISGIFIIHLVNIIRTSALTYMEKEYREYLDFNHNYTFQLIVYGVVFILWYYWTVKFILKNESKK